MVVAVLARSSSGVERAPIPEVDREEKIVPELVASAESGGGEALDTGAEGKDHVGK